MFSLWCFLRLQADGSRDVLRFDGGGQFIRADDVPTGPRGSDRLDLSVDQCTLLYTSEGTSIRRFNVCENEPMNDLTGLLHEAYALRILPGERAVLRAIARFDVGRMVADYERLHLRLVDRAGARSDPYREELVAAHDRGRVRS